MKNKVLNIKEVDIQYKNDEDSRNKLIKFLIDFVIENTDLCGDNHGK